MSATATPSPLDAPSDALGLESGRAVVVPYDPRWPALFRSAAGHVRRALAPHVLAVEHVGSTAVPGMASKPILDMLALVADFHAALAAAPTLALLGFEHRPENDIPDRHYFRRRLPDGRRTHHLSLAEPDSDHSRSTLLFRDRLRGDADLARRYEVLKVGLADRYPRDREAYTDGKTGFVRATLRRPDGPVPRG